MKYKNVIVFDPSVGGFNRGDNVIVDSVKKELKCLSSNLYINYISLHQKTDKKHREALDRADLIIVAGSNMLNLKMWPFLRHNRWSIPLKEALHLKDVILFGVGWTHPKDKSNVLGRLFYRKVLSSKVQHSVRDDLTLRRLKANGFNNVLNTACPTMWRLSKDHLSKMPKNKGTDVVTALTDSRRSPKYDKLLLEKLKALYRKVYFWPQGSQDISYLRSLNLNQKNIEILGTELEDYDELLESSHSLDYVGTRLHGGIRALQKKRRSLIIAVDQRAKEIGNDTGLDVLKRENIDRLEDAINDIKLSISLPLETIGKWRESLRDKLSL